jgi:hypothetical protein
MLNGWMVGWINNVKNKQIENSMHNMIAKSNTHRKKTEGNIPK